MTFARKRNDDFTSQYYLGADRILKCDEINDLGVIFDCKLTFTPHIDSLVARFNKLYGIGQRFAKDVKYPMIMAKIINTYITPVVEYCSLVWSQNRTMSERRFERPLHYGTRAALRVPFHHEDENYIRFEERMNILQLLTYKDRRIIASKLYIIKILRGQLETTLATTLQDLRHDPQYTSRSPNLFVIDRRRIPVNSPPHVSMSNINKYRNQFNIADEIPVIKRKIKEFLLEQNRIQQN